MNVTAYRKRKCGMSPLEEGMGLRSHIKATSPVERRLVHWRLHTRSRKTSHRELGRCQVLAKLPRHQIAT